MKQYIPCRIAALQDKLRERGLDAALIYDRENLIYFAGSSDLEGGVLCVPSDGTAELFCLWMEAEHMRRESGLKVTGYLFPADTQMAPQAGIGAAPCGIYTLFYQPEGLPVPPGGRAADEGGGYCGGLLPTAQHQVPGGDLAHPCGIQSIEGRNGCGTISCQSGDFGTGCVG